MNYITVNYSLNQTYSVHKDAFTQTIKKEIKKHKNIKVIEGPSVSISGIGQNLNISAKIDIKGSNDEVKEITNFTSSIENCVFDLINSKPSNIKIEINSIS